MGELDGLGYKGTRVAVTGCASGMGEATAKILGDLGAEIHAVDIKKPSIPHKAFYETDLSQYEQVETTASALRDAGPFDFLFDCAGVPHTFGPLQVMRVNYIGTRYLTELILPAIADGAGIAIIASNAGMGWQARVPTLLEILAIDDPNQATKWCEEHLDVVADGYGLSKELLIAWALSTAPSLGEQHRIRINCIAPCPTNTAFMVETIKELGQEYFDRFPYPALGRMATAEEQAWPLVLLNSPKNAVVTGAVLYTDQGVAGGMFTGAIDPSSMIPDSMR